jgi:hypothetical protein
VILDGAVVGIVDLIGLKGAKERTDVVDAAPREPKPIDDGDENGQADGGHMPKTEPCFVRPRLDPRDQAELAEEILRDAEDHHAEPVHRPDKEAACNPLVSPTEVLVHTDDTSEAPRFFYDYGIAAGVERKLIAM